MHKVMEAPRATPTPPLLMTLNEARGSPTPPPAFPMGQRQTTYDPQYLAQQQQQQQQQSRPAYESGFNAPPSGFDPTNLYAPPRASNPGYDRPIFAEGGGNSDVSKRRESSIFGAPVNLTPQGSKSRLREETFY
jgi:RalA-binding protein 1